MQERWSAISHHPPFCRAPPTPLDASPGVAPAHAQPSPLPPPKPHLPHHAGFPTPTVKTAAQTALPTSICSPLLTSCSTCACSASEASCSTASCTSCKVDRWATVLSADAFVSQVQRRRRRGREAGVSKPSCGAHSSHQHCPSRLHKRPIHAQGSPVTGGSRQQPPARTHGHSSHTQGSPVRYQWQPQPQVTQHSPVPVAALALGQHLAACTRQTRATSWDGSRGQRQRLA